MPRRDIMDIVYMAINVFRCFEPPIAVRAFLGVTVGFEMAAVVGLGH
jgi:hypothetical protein